MTPLAAYLAEIRTTLATPHTAETSFYPALKALLDAAGQDLNPDVYCVMNLRDQGGGLPDGGLFSADQVSRKPAERRFTEVWNRLKPSRGAIEVKAPDHDLDRLIASGQAQRYLEAYRHLLVTNVREFALVQLSNGKPSVIERFRLAKSSNELRMLCTAPAKAQALETRFLDFLRRCMRLPAPLTNPEDVAWFLASYAREALDEIRHADVPALSDVAQNLEAALGVGFGFHAAPGSDEPGNIEHAKARRFFHSVLVQTLFYGVFSAWVLWCRQAPSEGNRFSWRATSDLLHLTLLRVLFHEMTRPSSFFSLFLQQKLELAELILNRVDRATFFERFNEHEAVQFFYEPFLEAFDPALRKELGVWYTPSEVVRYMVERVDQTLRSHLGIEDGLADSSVQVLDPCCGTGGFLLAALERIHTTLTLRGDEGMAPAHVMQAACERVVGFEIMPAPFVVAHLQVSLYLQSLGARLPDNERAAIYLTNALTGWDRPRGRQVKLWDGLREEREAADAVKRKAQILVILGNPPYNAFAGVQPSEELESVDVYKDGLVREWNLRKFNLDDLYVRFFRVAERKIVDQTGRGLICFISNASYATDKSFVVLRERFLREFDKIAIDNLNGDSRETGKLTPNGTPDPSIFSTVRNREGIRVGTCVGLFVLQGGKRRDGIATVTWRDFWGENKRAELLSSVTEQAVQHERVIPSASRFWSFRPQAEASEYPKWPAITDLCLHSPISGLAEMRRGGLIAHDCDALERRMQTYFDTGVPWEAFAPTAGGLAEDAGRYPANATRAALLAAGERFEARRIRRYAALPFDTRWCYHTEARPLWNEPRPDLARQAWPGNRFIVTRTNAERPGEQCTAICTTALPDYHLLRPNVVAIPLFWRSPDGDKGQSANLAAGARRYLADLGLGDPDADEATGGLLWYHALAISLSPSWLNENRSQILENFPRVPLPGTSERLTASAALGRQLADLMDPDIPVIGVSAGAIQPLLRTVGSVRRVDNRPVDPAAGDLIVRARWGALQRGSVVMPGPGRITESQAVGPLGQCLDVWLNDAVHVANVPRSVWGFTVGGYQVVKKWLSYREHSILGRGLTLREAEAVTGMVRRICAILLLQPTLDENYRSVKDGFYRWPQPSSPGVGGGAKTRSRRQGSAPRRSVSES